MTKTTLICDICGRELVEGDYVKPNGRGGFINLYEKYPKQIKYTYYGKQEQPTYDLCVDCSMKVSRYVRSLWWESQQKQSLQ